MEQQSELLEKIVGLGLDNDQISAITDTLDACLNEIEALQAKITEYAAIIMSYEQKWDVIAEGEGKRMLEFGEAVKRVVIDAAYAKQMQTGFCVTAYVDRVPMEAIDLKQLYTNYKRK